MAFSLPCVGWFLLVSASMLVAASAPAPAMAVEIKTLVAKAEAGDRDAQEELGVRYYRAEGVPADPLEAARWLVKVHAANPSPRVEEILGELRAKHPDLGERYLAQHSPPEVRALATRAKAGEAAARFALARRQLAGEEVLPDHPRARAEISALATQGYAAAQFEMAGTTDDESQAKAWLEKAAAQNFVPALFQLGVNLTWSRDEAEQAKGRPLVERAAAGGHAPAMLFLARSYRDSENNAKALEWGNRALDAGTEGAQEFVTDLLEAMKVARERPAAIAAQAPKPAPAKPAPALASAPAPASAAKAMPVTVATEGPALPPPLTTDAKGLLILPYHRSVTSPIALERALRQGWAAAPSTVHPSKTRGAALANYYVALLATTLTEANRDALLRERIDELALIDFFALLEAQVSLKGPQALEFPKRYYTAAQQAELRRVTEAGTAAYQSKKPNTYAGLPPGRGWADSDLAAAQAAFVAKNFPRYLAALQKAAAKGSPGAMVSLAACYRDATGVPADPVQAARWLHFATTKNYGPAMVELGNYVTAGIGVAANEISGRGWHSAARQLRPNAPARPRVVFPANSADFRSYLAGTWLIEIKLNNRTNPLTSHFKFAPAAGTDFTLTTDARSNKPANTRAWTIRQTTSDWQPRTYDEIHFDYGGTRFSGSLSAGTLRGNMNKGGYSTGTWSASRRIDLDYFDLGEAALDQKRGDDAVHYFTQAIQHRPDALYYGQRGNAGYALFDYEPAIADYTTALRSDPKNFNTLYNRALAYHYSGNHAAAVTDTTQILTLPPPGFPPARLAAVYRTRALAQLRLGESLASQNDFAESRRLNPEQPRTREEMLASMAVTSEETNKIMGDLNRSLAKNSRELAEANKARAAAGAAAGAAANPQPAPPPASPAPKK